MRMKTGSPQTKLAEGSKRKHLGPNRMSTREAAAGDHETGPGHSRTISEKRLRRREPRFLPAGLAAGIGRASSSLTSQGATNSLSSHSKGQVRPRIETQLEQRFQQQPDRIVDYTGFNESGTACDQRVEGLIGSNPYNKPCSVNDGDNLNVNINAHPTNNLAKQLGSNSSEMNSCIINSSIQSSSSNSSGSSDSTCRNSNSEIKMTGSPRRLNRCTSGSLGSRQTGNQTRGAMFNFLVQPVIGVILLASLVCPQATTNETWFSPDEPSKPASSEWSFEGRQLERVPSDLLCSSYERNPAAHVNMLSLAGNRIEKLESKAFSCLGGSLRVLLLHENQIRWLGPRAFDGLVKLQVLRLSDNKLTEVPSPSQLDPLESLRHLDLSENQIKSIPSDAFAYSSAPVASGRPNLISLNLKGNPIISIAPNAFLALKQLKTLSLSETNLADQEWPVSGFEGLLELRFLYADRMRSKLQRAPSDLCINSPKLVSLVLKSNKLEQVDSFAHNQCTSLLLLDLSYNRIGLQGLGRQPFRSLRNLIDLYLAHNSVRSLDEDSFTGLTRLQVLDLSHNQIMAIHEGAFKPLGGSLSQLNIAHNDQLSALPIEGLEQLHTIQCFGNPQLRQLPRFPKAQYLALTFAYHCCDYVTNNNHHHLTTTIDQQQQEAQLNGNSISEDIQYPAGRVGGLVSSDIGALDGELTNATTNRDNQWPYQWFAAGAKIETTGTITTTTTSSDRYHRQSGSQMISTSTSGLAKAGQPFVPLKDLVVWMQTDSPLISTGRVDEVRHFDSNGKTGTASSPQRGRFRRAGQQLPAAGLIDGLARQIGHVRWARSRQPHSDLSPALVTDYWPEMGLGQPAAEWQLTQLIAHKLANYSHVSSIHTESSHDQADYYYYTNKQQKYSANGRFRRNDETHSNLLDLEDNNLVMVPKNQHHNPNRSHRRVQCVPKPSAFFPCKDLFDTWWLRLGIWFVFPLGLIGNFLVIVVLASVKASSSTSALTSIMWLAHSKRHIDVPRFLVINLAIADLLMALYLGILALVDLTTLGNFRLHAIRWQFSVGCQVAGFFAILSSELSVFILAIITLERNYAITNAVYLNRRLSLQHAMFIMFLGYAFAIGMALLPLQGINDYRKYSICLPLDLSPNNRGAQMYVYTLLAMNSLSFLSLFGCYLRMYCAIRGSQAWNTNDLRIAKRMSILVLTDFLCWSPIIGSGLAALLGYQIFDSTGLKIMTIFILPLNSVANPFLYAITTRKFKRDLDNLLHRLRYVLSSSKYPNGPRNPIQAHHQHHVNHGIRHHHEINLQQQQKTNRQRKQQLMVTCEENRRNQLRRYRLEIQGPQANKRAPNINYHNQPQATDQQPSSHYQVQQQQQQRHLNYLKQQPMLTQNQVTMNQTSCCCASSFHAESCRFCDMASSVNQDQLGQLPPSTMMRPRIVLDCDPMQYEPPEGDNPIPSGVSEVEFSHRTMARSSLAVQGNALNAASDSSDSLARSSILLNKPGQKSRMEKLMGTSNVCISSYSQHGIMSQKIPGWGRPRSALASIPDRPPAESNAWPRPATLVTLDPLGDSTRCCSNQTMGRSNELLAFGSDDLMSTRSEQQTGIKGQQHNSMMNQEQLNLRPKSRLRFKPIAKAWSSLQISLSGNRNRGPSQTTSNPNNLYQDRSPCGNLHELEHEDEEQMLNELDLNELFGCGSDTASPYLLLVHNPVLGQRRMSRSCEMMSRQNSSSSQHSSSQHGPTSNMSQATNDAMTNSSATTSHLDQDDQRVLLATINQLAVRSRRRGINRQASCFDGNSKPSECHKQSSKLKLLGNPSRSTRCRSWSPALLGKLEDCIGQIKSKLGNSRTINSGASTRDQKNLEHPNTEGSNHAELISDALGPVEQLDSSDSTSTHSGPLIYLDDLTDSSRDNDDDLGRHGFQDL